MEDAAKFLHKEISSTWLWRIDTDPELAASLGLLSKRRSKHALDPRSPDSFAKRLLWLKNALRRLDDGISPEQLTKMSAQDQLTYKLYSAQIQDYVSYTQKHKAYLCCINRLEGPQTDLALYAKYLPLDTVAGRDFYRDFLRAIPKQISEVIELLQIGMDERRTPPKISLDGVIDQIRIIVDGQCEAFSKPIDSKQTDKDWYKAWKKECMQLINEDGGISDAFSKLSEFLETKYIPSLRDEISACDGYPNGKEYYKDCLYFHTTTFMSADEIHQLGLDEVSRVRSEMEKIAAEVGYEGRLEEYMEHLRTSPDFAPESGEALCASYRDITGRVAPSMLKLFYVHTLPRTPFEIVETPAAHASTAPAAYYLAGSCDKTGSRPGTFYVNTSKLETRRTYECESLALHEAIPGHHTQGAVQGENTSLPNFRRYAEDRRYFEAPCRFPFYTGYIEGWGLHCETLGEELGLYKQPEDKIGQLSMEALRSCRLVVDTGMHALGWSPENALKYMLENTAMGEHDAKTEVARYITWPGQATAYKVGERFIRKLRTKCETKLVDSFDPRDFYDVVLQCGPVPLDTLEDLIDQYIRNSKTHGVNHNIVTTGTTDSFLESMSFANWCKCCTVPGTC